MKNTTAFFVSDLHGHLDRYRKLFKAVAHETPDAVFLGGDLLPSDLMSLSSSAEAGDDFLRDVLWQGCVQLREEMGEQYPRIFLILGNDDGKLPEAELLAGERENLWQYAYNRRLTWGEFWVFGYAYVPPTPFMLKDWERYDVSRFVDPGCTSPEEGMYSVPISADEKRWSTIQDDLKQLVGDQPLERAILLFHAPPYQTNLDRADLDGKMVDAAPLDVNVGSIAIQRFIKRRQPYVTLHGHVHESARLTGAWQDRIGQTYCFSAAHDGPELALVRFNLASPETASRELL
jgi:Icc-related predicted phosphoesterase